MDNAANDAPPETLQETCNRMRADILLIEGRARVMKKTIEQNHFQGDKGEMLGQITLAFRHLEDARMRVGKVIQHYDGGISVYDK